ncbi:MAG: L,D-transpeptidase [Gemmatimonadetes bacterium]|nr:L,D-transpeptidase [Gemmatimonadota bacterium]
MTIRGISRWGAAVAVLVAASTATAQEPPPSADDSPAVAETRLVTEAAQTDSVAASEAPAASKVRAKRRVLRDARIVISVARRRLWLLQGRDTIMNVPVAVGMNRSFSYAGKRFYFATPRGMHRVLTKKDDPVWVVPDWHYYEVAKYNGLEMVFVKPGERYDLSDGTYLEMRDGQVGRVNQFGNFWAFEPGLEIIFDGKIFVPPLKSPQRRIPDALGPHALVLGDGYMIHGVHEYDKDSVGRPVSHGCIRMHNSDLEQLYDMVPIGTPVYIR